MYDQRFGQEDLGGGGGGMGGGMQGGGMMGGGMGGGMMGGGMQGGGYDQQQVCSSRHTLCSSAVVATCHVPITNGLWVCLDV